MKKLLYATAVLGLAWVAVACSSDSDEVGTNAGNGASGDVAQAESVLGLTAAQQDMVAPLNEFAVGLFRQLSRSEADRDVVVSPLSAAFVLGMINQGATGETSAEIVKSLQLGNADRATVNGLFGQLIAAVPTADKDVTVSLANNVSLNTASGLELAAPYATAVEQYYEASAYALDFSAPEALQTVNAWSNSHTRGLIPSIVDQLDQNSVLCLLNAIYFKAKWADELNTANTWGMGFTTAQGEERQLNAMHADGEMLYSEQAGVKALRLPLAGGTYAMTFVLPAEKQTVDSYIGSLTAEALQRMAFAKTQVKSGITIFKTTADNDLKALLKAMGVERMFDSNLSQLGDMVEGQAPLYVSKMEQRTAIGVDEQGCEGAATTVAEVMVGADRTSAKEFYTTRPFLYYVSEVQSGAILFMGKFCGSN